MADQESDTSGSKKSSNLGGARPGSGQPPHKPTEASRQRVAELSKFGVPMPQIAASIGICEDTLRKHYQPEIQAGRLASSELVGNKLFQKATVENDTGALIWWTKARMGWKEQQDLNLKSEDGSMSPNRELTEAELEAELRKRGLPVNLLTDKDSSSDGGSSA